MSVLKLSYPVYTLNNQLLLPAGSELSEETLDTLISLNKNNSHPSYPLLNYGSVKNDLLNFLGSLPYNIIFADQEKTAHPLSIMESVHLVLPVLQALDYFRQYDFYTYRHILTVFALSSILSLDLITDYQDIIREAASGHTHDIGKLCVPLNILKKSNPLTKTELSIVKHHAAAGYALLCYYLLDGNNFSARVARDHHERKNGSGYPSGIQLKDHMVEIVAACDVYDALISERAYRPVSYDNRTACEEITKMAERGEISWEVVKALIAYNRKDKPHYNECKVSSEKRGSPPSANFYGVIAEDKNNPPDSKDN